MFLVLFYFSALRHTLCSSHRNHAIGDTEMTTRKNASRSIARSTVVPTILLKTIHDDILKANKSSTLTTKKMRVRLRATPTMREIHTRNATWIFTQTQADQVRAMFDPAFAKKQAKPARTPRASRASSPAPAPAPEPAE
jgi:hypothetical protein